jgi:2',3'-cyclic-nucleotide 2'-phosphodiesterase (5'-nucleotidase family)
MRRIAFPIAILLAGVLAVSAACRLASKPAPAGAAEADSIRTIRIFYTNDEEGYLEPRSDATRTFGGTANLMAALRRRGYSPNSDKALLLSGGDMWTGPAISSWFRGVPAVQVANAMGYDAAAIGNHEFDFGLETMRANSTAAGFPFLSANTVSVRTGKPPDFARPYLIRKVSGVRVAIIGLTTANTARIVVPKNVEGLIFTGYAEALRRSVAQARAEGAELVVVIAHVCPTELRTLIPVASELSIPLLGGGHCHSDLPVNFEQNDVRVIGAEPHWQGFVQADVTFDTAAGKVLKTEAELVAVEYPLGASPFEPDPAVEAIVAEWSAKANKALGEVIGYSQTGIERDWPLFNLFVDAWLWSYPKADIAISNFGGFREAIHPGEITRADIITSWPFENVLIDVELTGKQVADNLLCCGGAVAGFTYRRAGGRLIAKLKDGRDLDPGATYRVLVNSFMYAGGDNYLFAKQNPDGYDTGIHDRDPVIQWIISRQTSRERPVETLIDRAPRGPYTR